MNKIIVLSLVTALVSWSALAVDAPTRIIVNGVVLTMDKNDRRAEAVAIDGDRIVAVGANTEIRKLAGAETDVVDAGGRTVIPGLIDTHLHAIRGGQTYTFETYWYDATTLVAALDALKSAASRKGPGQVGRCRRIMGSGTVRGTAGSECRGA